MTTPSSEQQKTTIETDPALEVEYLTNKLVAQCRETSQTWAALQSKHREVITLTAAYQDAVAERQASEEEATQLRAEVAQLRSEVQRLLETLDPAQQEKVSARH